MEKINYIYVIAVISGTFSSVSSRQFCNQRSFGKDSVVCVCNLTHCDDLDPVQRKAPGVITVFETNRGGARFQESSLNWGANRTENTQVHQTITIDRSKRVQTILGFGGSFTDATGYMISQLPVQLQERFVADMFSERGIEFNLNRLPIGGADFSRRPYTYADGHVGDFELKNWALQPEDLQYKIPLMKKAKSISKIPQKFLASPWSAPAWMKTNNEIHHGGFLRGRPGEQYYKTWANYFVKFLNAYKAQGLDIWGLTVENEPSAGNNPRYSFNSMGFTKELERDFIRKDLGPALAAAGYSPNVTKLLIFDDQRDVISDWASTVYNDPDAVKYVAGTAFHWYQNKAENLANLQKTHNINPNKFILNTESSIGGVPSLGNWYNLETFARDIITDLNHYVVGYISWNMALNLGGGPNWANLTADAPIIVDPARGEYYKQPDYYGHGHFSKFIVPDSVRLAHQESIKSDQILTTVALRPDGAVVVVALNTADSTVNFAIKDGAKTVQDFIRAHEIHTYIYWP